MFASASAADRPTSKEVKGTETISFPQFGGGAFGIECTPSGTVYVACGPRILEISPSGVVSHYAGSAISGSKNGKRLESSFDGARGLCWTSQSELLVCTRNAHCIRSIKGDDVTTYAGGTGRGFLDGLKSHALFSVPTDLVEHNGNLYVTDTGNHRIRVINMETGMVTSIGSGIPSSEGGGFQAGSLHSPLGIDVRPDVNVLIVSCRGSNSLMTVDLDALMIAPFSLPGADGKPLLKDPAGLTCAHTGDVYVCDEMNHQVRCVMADGSVFSAIGSTRGRSDGPFPLATTANPWFVKFNNKGDLLWTEGASSIRKAHKFLQLNLNSSLDVLLAHERFTTTAITNTPSGETLNICATPLSMLLKASTDEINVLDSFYSLLQTSTFPISHLRAFVSMVFGNVKPQNTKLGKLDGAILLSNLYLLATALGTPIYIEWLKNTLMREIFGLFDIHIAQLILSLPETNFEASWNAILSAATIKFSQHGQNVRKESLERFQSALSPLETRNPELYAKTISSVSAATTSDKLPMMTTNTPSTHVRACLSKLAADTFAWISEGEKKPSAEPNLTLIIPGTGFEAKVHDWVLFAKWEYYRRLLRSGMAESQSSVPVIELPDDLPPSLLKCILEVIYDAKLESHTLLTAQEKEYAVSNAGQFDLADTDDQVTPIFQELYRYCSVNGSTV